MCITRPRILIATITRWSRISAGKLFEKEFEVVGIVNNGHAMVSTSAELKPDAIVVDISMPVLNGLDAGQHLCCV